MDSEALLLPEPFSEKNIDGSPITKSQEGRSLFRNPPKADRRVAERWSGGDRRAPGNEYAPAPEFRQYSAPAEPAPQFGQYNAPVSQEPEYPEYGEPVSEPQGFAGYSEPVSREPEYTVYSEPAPRTPEPAGYGAPAFDEPAAAGGGDGFGYDPERFEPPVDEKPGMIPNPMKMPPVKKKSSLDYDIDGGYGDYGASGPEYTAPAGDDGGYGYYSESGPSSGDGYGFYDGDDSAGGFSPPSGEDPDYGYYDEGGSDIGPAAGETEDSGFYTGADTEDFGSVSGGEADDGGYGDFGSFDDSDYGSDYGSGSDLSSDYY